MVWLVEVHQRLREWCSVEDERCFDKTKKMGVLSVMLFKKSAHATRVRVIVIARFKIGLLSVHAPWLAAVDSRNG